jgi:hypothetical protein
MQGVCRGVEGYVLVVAVVVVVVVAVAVALLLRTFTDGLPHGHGVLWTADEQAAGAAANDDDDDDADSMHRRVAAWALFWTWSCAVVRFCSGGVGNVAAAAASDDVDDDADNICD